MRRWHAVRNRSGAVFWVHPDEVDWGRDDNQDAESIMLLRSLQLSLCGAYESGLISSDVMFFSPMIECFEDEGQDPNFRGCAIYSRYVKSFPPKRIFDQNYFNCVPSRETFLILSKRRGGKEYTESKEFLFMLSPIPLIKSLQLT